MAEDPYPHFQIKVDRPDLIQIGDTDATEQRRRMLAGCLLPTLALGVLLVIGGLFGAQTTLVVIGICAAVFAAAGAYSVRRMKVVERTLIAPVGITWAVSDGDGRHEERVRAEDVHYVVVEMQSADRFGLHVVTGEHHQHRLLLRNSRELVERYAERIGAMLKAPTCVGIFEPPDIHDVGGMVGAAISGSRRAIADMARQRMTALTIIDHDRGVLIQRAPGRDGERVAPIRDVTGVDIACDEHGTRVSSSADDAPDRFRYRYHVEVQVVALGTLRTGRFQASVAEPTESNPARDLAEQMASYLQAELAGKRTLAAPVVADPLR
jgi:hypothetical protein